MKTPRQTRRIKVGSVAIGGGAPVSIQSMTNTPTSDPAATLAQIRALARAGCDIIRCAVPDEAAVRALPEILSGSPIPVIADIHFDYRLALGAIRAGIHGIRINPGNIGSGDRVRAVAEAAGEAGIPIRVGANSGSLPKGLYESHLAAGLSPRDAMAQSLAEASLEQVKLLEQYDFRQIKVSLKSSSVLSTVDACRRFAELSDIPLHIGITESGVPAAGLIKSAVGIGTLLLEGIGETIRVSLTADPLEEVRAGLQILEAAGLRSAEPEFVSCPTCGRTKIDLARLASEVYEFIESLKQQGKRIHLHKIAVMGCVVNGPGEARDADLGLAGGDGKAVIFRSGTIVATLSPEEALERIKQEIQSHVSG